MDEIIALLKFAVDNEHNFTKHDPDGVKRAWIEQARKALAAQQSVHTDPPSACPVCGTLPEEMEHDPTCPLATAGG